MNCGRRLQIRAPRSPRHRRTASAAGALARDARSDRFAERTVPACYLVREAADSVVVSLAMSGDEAARLDSRFAKLWAASTVSALGSGLATVAAPLFVAARTGNPLAVSAAAAVAWLPWLLFALPGGVLVDRVDRRRLMVAVDWIRVAAMGVLATAILTGRDSIPLLYVVLFVVNTGEIVMRSASQAMVADVVPPDRLERANGWIIGGATTAEFMLAEPLAGFLFKLAN